MSSTVRRLVVELNPRTHDALTRRCEVESLNKTTVTNRAVQIYDLLQQHVEVGGTVALIHQDGHVDKLVIL